VSRKSGPKQALFGQLARVARALGSATRLELLDYLAQGERSVDSLAGISGLSVANTSKHLQQLRQAGLVLARKDGLHVYYRMSGDDVLEAIVSLRGLAESRLAEVDRLVASYLSSKDDMEAVAAEELMARLKDDLVTILDVRPPEEFAQGHLPEALNIPLSALEKHLGDLPSDREIIAYCRGPWCVLSFAAVAQLRKRGFKARRLAGGLPEWRSEGRPVASHRSASR
jgi:rhodanese-related sulfurtransferase/DNA-binding transcriptional ArsR family regulator